MVIHIAKVNFSAAWLAWPISSCYSQPVNEGYGVSNLLDFRSDGAVRRDELLAERI
jgi:hypothetical protein